MRIADLLPPAVRSAARDDPDRLRLLDALLNAVDGQQALLTREIDGLWQDLFVDSCADEALPYIGGLLGLPPDATRLEIAHTIALRRRKGTPGALEDFAEVLTGWTARVVEGWQVTVWSQRLAHPPPLRPATIRLAGADLARVGTPFERARRTVDLRRRWHPAAADVVVWPWHVRTYRDVEVAPLPGTTARFALHPLGSDAPLYVQPRPLVLGSDVTGASAAARTRTETDAPVRATYDVLLALADDGDVTVGDLWTLHAGHPLADPGGTDDPPLIRLTVDDVPIGPADLRFGSLPRGAPPPAPPPPSGAIVDLARGHVEVGASVTGTVRATWHRAQAGSLGAIAADGIVTPGARVVVEVDPQRAGTVAGIVGTVDDAFAAARARSAAAGLTAADSQPGRPDVEIRLLTSDRLAAPAPQAFVPDAPRWRIVAAALATPTIVGDLDLDLDEGCVEIEGVHLTGDLRGGAGLRGLTLRSVTMDPAAGASVTLAADAWTTAVHLERSLLPTVHAELSAYPLTIRDCVVDGRGAAHRVCDPLPPASGSGVAVAATDRFAPALDAEGVTFLGTVACDAVRASDCILVDGLTVVQTESGCLRYCDLGPSDPAGLPPTYRCGPFPPAQFASTRFASAGYVAPLLDETDPRTTAASDGGEIGAYHRDGRPARVGRLRDRIHEFVPLGVDVTVTLGRWEEP
jgi:hypothetical protein